MPITLTCPSCGKSLRAPDRLAGRRVKCPGCGAAVAVPDTDPDAGETYDLADPDAPPTRTAAPEPEQPATSPLADPTPVKPLAVPTPESCTNCGAALRSTDHHCPKCGYMPRTGGFARLDRDRFATPGAEAAERRYQTGRRIRLGGLAALVLLAVGAVAWYVTGPARGVHVTAVQPVHAIPALVGLETREPYSLFTGAGDRSLGIKAPQSKSNPNPAIANVDVVYSLGGSDQLMVVQPDAQGQRMLIVMEVRQSLLDELEMERGYDTEIRATDVTITDDAGNSYPVILLQERFNDAVQLDLGGASGSPMHLFPPTIEPTVKQTRPGEGGDDATGTVHYDMPEAKGSVDFSSMSRLSGAPGVRGLSATGQIAVDHPERVHVGYDYRGDTMDVAWSDAADGWWATRAYTDNHSMSPWSRHRVAVLIPRPAGEQDLQVSLAGRPVATVSTADITLPPAATPPPTPAPAAPSAGGSGPTNNPLAYFDMLVEARHRARGLANMSHMQQLGLGIRMYLDQHGSWPASLDDLRDVLGGGLDRILINEQTGVTPGYIYEVPPPGADPATTPVLWQADAAGQKDPGAPVLYADGHLGPAP